MDNDINNINNELKKAENLELPESLSKQSVEARLKNEKQNGASRRVMLRRLTAIAAVFAIVCTALFVTKPWENKPSVIGTDPNGGKLHDSNVEVPSSLSYEEIEGLFLEFRKTAQPSFYDKLVQGLSGEYKYVDGAVSAESAPGMNAAQTPTDEGEVEGRGGIGDDEHGETNEQVAGVSEADILKNDGEYLYILFNETSFNKYWAKFENGNDSERGVNPRSGIVIVKTKADGSMQTVGFIIPENENGGEMYLNDFYITGNTAIAVYSLWAYTEDNYGTANTMIATFDITDRTSPVETNRFYQTGGIVSTRLIGNELILITSHSVAYSCTEDYIKKNCIPFTGTAFGDLERIPAENICVMDELSSPSYLIVTDYDITGTNDPATAAVLGGGSEIYCTTDKLYVVNGEYDEVFANTALDFGIKTEVAMVRTDINMKTTVYSFSIGNSSVKYNAKTTVSGSVLDQFSMDEYNGYLRLATTTGSSTNATNQVYVLDSQLNTVGKLEGIAPGESIQSVRFTGAKGYVVTFLQTDPLFVLDLSDPTAPSILGELKIPGFSAYLHPISDTLLAGIGFGGNDEGTDGTVKVSLFDVSDPANPVEADNFIYGISGTTFSNSAASNEHRAVCWNGSDNILYFPVCSNTWYYTGDADQNQTTSVIGLKIDAQSKSFGDVSEYRFVSNANEYYEFCRCTYTGSVVYGYSQHLVASFDMATGNLLDSMRLEDCAYPDEFTPRLNAPEIETTENTTAETTSDSTEPQAPDVTIEPAVTSNGYDPNAEQTTPAFNPADTTAAPVTDTAETTFAPDNSTSVITITQAA